MGFNIRKRIREFSGKREERQALIRRVRVGRELEPKRIKLLNKGLNRVFEKANEFVGEINACISEIPVPVNEGPQEKKRVAVKKEGFQRRRGFLEKKGLGMLRLLFQKTEQAETLKKYYDNLEQSGLMLEGSEQNKQHVLVTINRIEREISYVKLNLEKLGQAFGAKTN